MRSLWLLVGLVACADPLTDESDGGPAAADVGAADGLPPLPGRDAFTPGSDGAVDLDGGPPDGPDEDGAVFPPDRDAQAEPPDAAPADAAECPLGAPCNPIVVARFPQSHAGDTARAPTRDIDRYDCAPGTNEGGPEVYYAVDLPADGTLTVTVEDGDGVDIDLHLLDALDGSACVARDDVQIRRALTRGRYFVVADTWVDAGGRALAGPYALTFEFAPDGAPGDCAVEPTDLRMFWGACSAGIDCYERDGQRYLRTPSVGPVVKEAHLVTVDDGFGEGWPSSLREGIEGHYARTVAATGYQMDRREPWAPAGEGGSQYGQGSTGRKVPVVDEAWYVNMYWRDRPAPGTRLRIRNPANGRTVVASGGYETGPGANTAIGGVTEEIHDYLGTGHRDALEIGFLVDQELPLGPIDCQ